MKRETEDENKGVLSALLSACGPETAPVPELLDIADPYDGYTRSLPVTAFLPAVMAACGIPAISHGLEAVGPKFGVTHRKVLRVAGIDVDIPRSKAGARVANSDIGWAYLDQKVFCPCLHDLVSLRRRIVKRPVVTTVEVLLGPLRGQQRTHLWTGYVHKNYPPVYAELARFSGFDSMILTRGVEGGTIPSLQQPARVWSYLGGGEARCVESDPRTITIQQSSRAVPIPPGLARESDGEFEVDSDVLAESAAAAGLAALAGEQGPAFDALVYGASICLYRLERQDSLQAAAEVVRAVLTSGQALARFEAAR
jgi:anthranilate phosphoribosyltransferase